MYILIVLLPLVSSFICGFFGYLIGGRGSTILSTSILLSCMLLSFGAFHEVGIGGSPCYITLFTWIDTELLHINWGFMFDSATVTMLVVVTTVSSLVHLYSVGYMSEDPHISRFMSYLSLFTFFMLVLVTADNFVQLFMGWEGVGLSSYPLINFWHTRIQANKSAMKALIVNRVGDFGLCLGILGVFHLFRSLDFSTVFSSVECFSDHSFVFLNAEFHSITVICLLLFIGVMGKSAQVGLHTWLPDAMEGPTPVSALIHAATMVTAGVFLLLRCSPVLEHSPVALLTITVIGAVTAFFAATTALVQNDLKKVIAYSTCSQPGYMVFACGVSSYSMSMFHLMNHAFFKALLFLGAGCVIHAVSDEQDMRRMGSLIRLPPFTYVMMLIGSLSLMGFPFLSGFYSKDGILEVTYGSYSLDGHFAYWFGTISAFFTAFYSFRLLYLTFIGNANGRRKVMEHAHESSTVMVVPLITLSFGSVFSGYFTKDMMIGVGTDFWGSSLMTLPENYSNFDGEFLSSGTKLIPVVFSIGGAVASFVMYHFFGSLIHLFKIINRTLYGFLSKKWYFDKLYNEYVNQKVLDFGYNVTFKTIDRGFIEIIGPYGLSRWLHGTSRVISSIQSGSVYHYGYVMFLGLICIIGYVVYSNTIVDDSLAVVILTSVMFHGFNKEN